MGVYERSRQAVVSASAQKCFDALVDYEHLHEWQSRLRCCEVLSRDAEGRGRDVAYQVDVTLRTVRYTLRHDYDQPTRIGSTYLEGDFRSFDGEYAFEDRGDDCLVTLALRIDPGMWVPRRIARMVDDAVMRRTLVDLQSRVGRGAA